MEYESDSMPNPPGKSWPIRISYHWLIIMECYIRGWHPVVNSDLKHSEAKKDDRANPFTV